MHTFPDATADDARSAMDDVRRGLMLRWAGENLPGVSLRAAGGMLHAFAGSTSSTPMPRSERRAIIDGARRGASYVVGGAR